MSVRKIVQPDGTIAFKDENGAFVILPKAEVKEQDSKAAMDGDAAVSIDDLKRRGLNTINLIMRGVWQEAVSPGGVSRESVQNLKDCFAMLQALSKEEKELLEKLSTEELEDLINADIQQQR